MEIRIGCSKSSKINILQYIALIVGLAIIGFVGGFFSSHVLGKYFCISTINASDAVSIANTYIVFTTIIFVGFTVLLAAAGIIFAHQTSLTKSIHLKQIADEFIIKIQTDDNTALQIVKELLKNEEAREAIDQAIRIKAEEITNELCEKSNMSGIDSLVEKIDGGTF